MILSQRTDRYHRTVIFLHWLIFILFIIMYLIIQIRGYLPKEDPMRTQLILLHKSLGIGILALVICRLLSKWATFRPPIIPPVSRLRQKLITLGHIALYAVMLIMPISGYLMSVAGGYPVAFFGIRLPYLVEKNEALGNTMYSTHVWVSQLIYFLVGLHVLLALWHHFVRRDNTLLRMMPRRK